MLKLQPSYRSPFDRPGFFHAISRGEAARLMCQWRRNGLASKYTSARIRAHRAYRFTGPDGETAMLALSDPR